MLLRPVATLLLATALAGCNLQSTPQSKPSPTSPAHSQAADLRTHLDLLLGEQVIIVAKQAAAAANHSDAYTAYTSLLAVNSADLTSIFTRAYGNTTGVQFAQVWNSQNTFLVDYTIGVVTHNDTKAKDALAGLNQQFVLQFANFLEKSIHLPLAPVSQLITDQIEEDKAFIDDAGAANYIAFYPDVQRAYAQATPVGDILADKIATSFADKFPGDATKPEVTSRVSLNLALQEHSYLATMSTDAAVSGRASDRTAALRALSANNDAVRAIVQDPRFALAWSQEIGSLQTYALKADAQSRTAVSETAVAQLVAATDAPSAIVAVHENASIRVIDDQRSKAPSVANDDRTAATSMQPIADLVER